MRAVVYEQFAGPLVTRSVADPNPPETGVVIRVRATGICRSDWHGWMGHDPGISLPHVPGHELSGEIVAVGREVSRWRSGDRATLPFVCGCGHCPQCATGNEQVCDNQFQPGFTHWGSFAEYVAIDYADVNLVRLPEQMSFVVAASLGCRIATSFRAVVDQGRTAALDWVAVHGCGGLGLSAVMIAAALGARVVAIDITEEKLDLARSLGATAVVDARQTRDVAAAVREITGGGAHVSLDALGSPVTSFNSVLCLRKRGRHLQVGLLLAEDRSSPLPMDAIVANELEVIGCHGMQAHRYPALLEMIADGSIQPERLIGKIISLEDAPAALSDMEGFQGTGVTVIDRF